jgi:tetratricopeptide (TPR) repeat protein
MSLAPPPEPITLAPAPGGSRPASETQSVAATQATSLGSLWATLERARLEFVLGRQQSARQLTEGLLALLEVPVQASVAVDFRKDAWTTITRFASDIDAIAEVHGGKGLHADRELLLASVKCLIGQIFEALYRDAAGAVSFYHQSIVLYEKWRDQIDAQTSSTRVYSDFGIALSRAGRIPESIEILKVACSRKAAPPDAFDHLGRAYQKAGMRKEAVIAFEDALKTVPGDSDLLRGLAESLEEAGRTKEAVTGYCEAAHAIMRTNRPKLAAQLASRALRLDPTNVEALAIGVSAYMAAHNRAEALKLTDSVLHLAPNDAWALGLRGMLLRTQGDLEEARTIFEKVTVESVALGWVLVEQAQTIYDLNPKKYDQSLKILDRAMQLAQQESGTFEGRSLYANVCRLKALMAADRGHREEAIRLLREAIEFDPQSAPLLIELGNIHAQARETAEALSAFEKALGIAPNSKEAFLGKAEVLQQTGKLEEALLAAMSALRLDPLDENGIRIAAEILVAQGHPAEAIALIGNALEHSPDRLVLHRIKARTLMAKRDIRGAAEALERANQIEPNDVDTLLALASTYCKLDRLDEAASLYGQATILRPDSPAVLQAKAYYLTDIAEFRQALDLLETVVRERPKQAFPWGLMGWCFQHLGARFAEKAYECFGKAAKFAKQSGLSSTWYEKGTGNALCLLGRKEDASRIFTEILKNLKYERSSMDALHTLGWCHYRLGNYDEAVRLLQAAVSVDQDSIFPNFDLALSLLAGGRQEAAIAEYSGALKVLESRHRSRQRRACYVALFDLLEVKRNREFGPAGDDIERKLTERLKEAGFEVDTKSWFNKESA